MGLSLLPAGLVSLLLLGSISLSVGQVAPGVCDSPRNANLPFCDSSLPITDRVQDLISRLTVDEKIGLLDHTAAGATTNVDLDAYTWWNEALHGVSISPGVKWRAPTPHATSFPQIINLAQAFNKQLWFAMGNTTGNEARAFFNSGNSGLTFWAPNINIYRDPRWGRAHETSGEDPKLSSEYAKAYIRGMQGDHPDGFLKVSACCKHFAAHSQEENRFQFNSVVNPQDMADTYLPAFKSCVQEAGVSCLMCAYNAVNGVPACANYDLLTGLAREEWGFDGYITTDCGGASMMMEGHNYTQTGSDTCKAVLEAGVDVECHWENDPSGVFAEALQPALDEGKVTVQMMDTALARLARVQMRLGYFEKEATRPYKELQSDLVDSEAHKALALEAARESIVLLKNSPTGARDGRLTLPVDTKALKAAKEGGAKRASMALIGPHVHGRRDCTISPGECPSGTCGSEKYGCSVWLANYNGIPSEIKEPLDEVAKVVPDVAYEFGVEVNSMNATGLQAAVDLARDSVQVVLLVGLNGFSFEGESRERDDLHLPGLQNELIRRVLEVAREPVIMIVVAGGALDLSEWENDARVGAIIWAGYLGEAAGEAIADVLFGVYNPSGRLAQTFYYNEFLGQVAKEDMNMRPVRGSPGRTHRFFTGQALYPFGFGLSYTTFTYAFEDGRSTTELQPSLDASGKPAKADCSVEINVTVRNAGSRAGDHSVLWYIASPGAGLGGRPIKSLLDFDKVANVFPFQSKMVTICLNRDDFQLANEDGVFVVVPGEWTLTVGNLERRILVT